MTFKNLESQVIDFVLGTSSGATYPEIVNAMQKTHDCVPRTIRRAIQRAVDNKLIQKRGDRYTQWEDDSHAMRREEITLFQEMTALVDKGTRISHGTLPIVIMDDVRNAALNTAREIADALVTNLDACTGISPRKFTLTLEIDLSDPKLDELFIKKKRIRNQLNASHVVPVR